MEALRQRRDEMLEGGMDVPPVYNEVVARVLRWDTPLGVRQYAAGDAQAAQLQADPLELQDVARLFLAGVGQMPGASQERVAGSLGRAWWPVFSTRRECVDGNGCGGAPLLTG